MAVLSSLYLTGEAIHCRGPGKNFGEESTTV